jgi:hypothetical protein
MIEKLPFFRVLFCFVLFFYSSLHKNIFILSTKRLEEFKVWNLLEIVKHFRILSNNKLAFLQTGFLKPNKFKEYQEKVRIY